MQKNNHCQNIDRVYVLLLDFCPSCRLLFVIFFGFNSHLLLELTIAFPFSSIILGASDIFAALVVVDTSSGTVGEFVFGASFLRGSVFFFLCCFRRLEWCCNVGEIISYAITAATLGVGTL